MYIYIYTIYIYTIYILYIYSIYIYILYIYYIYTIYIYYIYIGIHIDLKLELQPGDSRSTSGSVTTSLRASDAVGPRETKPGAKRREFLGIIP